MVEAQNCAVVPSRTNRREHNVTHAFSEPDIPVCAPPDPHPNKPKFEFPPLACDCHAHICGPQSIYKYIPERIYSPPDALLPEYRRILDALGCSRAVLVQPSFYGTDNSAMLAAIKAAGSTFRGVAVIGDDATASELEAMHAAGIRGARLNIVDVREGKGQLPIERIAWLADRIKPFGWHLEFLMHVDEFPQIDRTAGRLPVDVVFAHLGYIKAEKGITTPGFQSLLRLLRGGRAWVKLTGAYRISSQTLPHADTNEFAHALLDTAPHRIVWGTDWPHVMTKWMIPMPNDGAMADLLLDWIPDAALRLRILADNPAALYGFP
jgi:predicted TIM-barrel fold metal-dependent hydrolase